MLGCAVGFEWLQGFVARRYLQRATPEQYIFPRTE